MFNKRTRKIHTAIAAAIFVLLAVTVLAMTGCSSDPVAMGGETEATTEAQAAASVNETVSETEKETATEKAADETAQEATENETEKETEKPTEAVTETVSEKATEKVTQKATEPATEKEKDPHISAQLKNSIKTALSEYDEFTADTSDSQVKVVFSTDCKAKKFKVLALNLEDVDDNGNMKFSTKAIYTLDSLTPECPLVVGMTFYGTIPTYGISYVDASGKTRRFTVELSGKDGSVLLCEF